MTEQTKTIHQSIIAAQADVESVARESLGQVGNQKFKYATLEAVQEMMKPIFAKHGLAFLQWVDGDDLISVILHESGEQLGCGKYKLGDFTKAQERGAQVSYARRYQMCAVWGIVQEEDPDKAQAVWPTKKARETFRLTTMNKIEVAADKHDLELVWTGHGKKINEMQASPNGDDQLVAQEIFALFKVRGKEFEQAKALERAADAGNFEARE